FLGAIREEPSDDCGQRSHEIAHGAKGGAGRTRVARRAVAMSAVRSDAARGIRKTPYARTLLLPRCTSECARGLWVYSPREWAARRGGCKRGARRHRRQRRRGGVA